MIDCPICHVKNEDDARFCAECGQRLGLTGPAAQPIVAPPASAQILPQGQPDTMASRPAAGRLNSPLLTNAGTETDEPSGVDTGSEVSRLRQMSARTKEERPVQMPETPYKNPFDPRNHGAESPTAAPEQPHRKLRSPLLAGEEFDDDEPINEEPPAPSRGRGLHSPILGSGDAPSAHLRSPLLGGGRMPGMDDEDDQALSGGHLRSPLLGGGSHAEHSGHTGHTGNERRKAPPDADFGGPERRRGGLRSPILGGGEDDFYYDEPEDDEPLDEDNPNVLRSPLLAAKRPLSDRPAVKSPAGSNVQNPARAQQTQEPMAPGNKPASNSFTNLRSISAASGNALPTTPNAPAQSQAQPPSSQAQAPQAPMMAPFGNAPSSGPPAANAAPPQAPPAQSGYKFGIDELPSTVPAAFQNVQATAPGRQAAQPAKPAVAPPAAAAPTPAPSAQPVTPQASPIVAPGTRVGDNTTGGIKVQPPATTGRSGATRNDGTIPSAPLDDIYSEPRSGKPASRMLPPGYSDDEPVYDRFAAPAKPPSAVPKLIGALAVCLLLAKLWVITAIFGTEWRNMGFIVVDQFVGLILIVCLIALAFSHKS